MSFRSTSAREQELLEANTRYLLRARASEGYLHTLLNQYIIDPDLEEEIEQYLEKPWLLTAEVQRDEEQGQEPQP